MHKRRAIDRILDEDYLAAVDLVPMEDLRVMRDECDEQEAGISYARRVLQGKLDIVIAEVERRREGRGEGAVIEQLASVLADRGQRGVGVGRASRFLVPPAVPHHRRWLDQVVDDDTLARLSQRTDGDLQDIADGLIRREREVSQLRRQLLDRIDALQAALTRRYQTDGIDVADILSRRI